MSPHAPLAATLQDAMALHGLTRLWGARTGPKGPGRVVLVLEGPGLPPRRFYGHTVADAFGAALTALLGPRSAIPAQPHAP